MNDNIKTKTLEWLDILENRPKMIISGDRLSNKQISYDELSIYVDGYIQGINNVLNRNLGKEICEWFQNKNNISSMPLYLADFLPVYYKDKSEEELIGILIEELRDFFKNWK